MDPIISEYLTTLVTRMQALSSGPYTAATEQQLTSLISSTISEYATKYGTTNPESVIAIRALNSPEMVAKYTQGATFISEATKSGIPAETARAIVRDALVNGTPIGQTSAPVAPELDQAIQQARQATREFLNNASKSQVPSQITSGPSKAVESFVSARRYLPQGTTDVANTVAAAESAAPAVAQDVAKVLVPKVEESSSSIYKFVSSIIPGLASLTRNRSVLIGGGIGLAALGAKASGILDFTPTLPKSSPEIPIGPSAMQNLPSAAPTEPSADTQRRSALKDQLRNAPDSTAKWDAYASVLYEDLVANDEELAKVRQELDTLPYTATDAQKQALAIRYNTASTNRNSLRDDYTKALENKDKAAKEAVANSPENIALIRQASQASIDAQSASAAASRASAARSAVEAAAIEAKRIRDEQMGPLELAAAEQSLKNAQILGAKAEVDLQLIQADQRQRAAVDVLQSKFDAGELTEEQFTTQALAASGKIEQLATYRLNLQRNQDAREQAAIQQGNWEKSFGLQQQAAAIAQTEAVANREFRQSQLALQQAAEARAAAQARAQNMQALTAAQTQRQAAYNQAATEYERFGVATPNRIQGLQDLKAPIPAAQAAGMLGLDVNSPEFKAVYDTYSMALAPGQGAQQPAPVTPAPAPVPNPVTNSIPLISMPSMGNTPYLTQALGGLKTGYSPA